MQNEPVVTLNIFTNSYFDTDFDRQEELRKQRERAERTRKEWERRMNPKTKGDFDLLYSHLESKLIVKCA